MSRTCVLLMVLTFCVPVQGHVVDDQPYIVIDSDAGIDDVVALTLALQHPRARLGAIVFTPGAAGLSKGIEHMERLLHRFNRGDVSLFSGVSRSGKAPPPAFRGTAEALVRSLLPEVAPRTRREFSPAAYRRQGGQVTVLVLGPLTSLAAALRREPGLREKIEEIIVAGPRDPKTNFNLSFDRTAWETVRDSGLPVEFVRPGPGAAKPPAWSRKPFRPGPGTSVGEAFLRAFFERDPVRRHYLEKFPRFYDELVFLYYTDSAAFQETETKGVFAAKPGPGLLAQFTRLATRGRQGKRRVVLTDGNLPAEILRADIRKRRAAILEKNGEVEWFAQLLLNELHEHLGAYSVIGVKMGLRAAEILNAPQHAMKVVSHTGPHPPASCMDDGLIVATGSTPGRRLFRNEPGPAESVAATFEYNGRRVTLHLKDACREKVRATIRRLVKEFGLEDERYWQGVRAAGIDIWENWHRTKIFAAEGKD